MGSYHYEPPANEADFEELVCDIYNAKYQTNSFELYRARGSNQYGVDVFSQKHRIVIQCKKKDPNRKDSELRAELATDLNETASKTHGWPHCFDTLLFVTSTKKFSSIQDQAIRLTDKNREVQFVAWLDLEKHIHRYADVRERHYPHLSKTARSEKGTQRSLVIRLPIPKTIGANAMIKDSVTERFNRLGKEREKRFGKSAYPTMYKNFKRDFGIGDLLKWTTIWDWPETAVNSIRTYLDDKWHNTIAGRKEAAQSKAGYVPTRPQLFAKEKQWLDVLGIEMKSEDVKKLLHHYFGVSSHAKLSQCKHWLFVLHLEQMVKQRIES